MLRLLLQLAQQKAADAQAAMCQQEQQQQQQEQEQEQQEAAIWAPKEGWSPPDVKVGP